MKIAIDLNDVIRDFSNNFLRYYIERYNHEFDLDEFEFWTNRLGDIFPFNSEAAYHNFLYNDFAFELFGKCGVCSRNLEAELNTWTEKTIKDLDLDNEIELMFVSPMEYGLSIGNTYFFLSKLGTKIREVYFPKNSVDIWEKCDVLITANPDLLECKPEGKTSVKIKMDYNKDVNSDYEYPSFSSFLIDPDNTKKLVNHEV